MLFGEYLEVTQDLTFLTIISITTYYGCFALCLILCMQQHKQTQRLQIAASCSIKNVRQTFAFNFAFN